MAAPSGDAQMPPPLAANGSPTAPGLGLSLQEPRCYNRRVLAYGILGPLEVHRDGAPLPLAGHRQRGLLALLLLNANRVLPAERIIDRLWGESPPRTAATSLQNAVSQLRKLLDADAVETRTGGYLLRVEPDQVDLLRFEALVARARDEETRQRIATLDQALELWRGDPLADIAFLPFAAEEIRRLEELRLATLEQRIAAELEHDVSPKLVAELSALVGTNPFREGLQAQLMLALYRAGRQAEALETYHRARRLLVDELGVEPGPRLQGLFGQILRQDADLARGVEPAPETQLDEAVAIARATLAGRVVPVLGRPPEERLLEALAGQLDDESGAPGDVARLAQRVAVMRGVGPLYDELHALAARADEPGSIHRFLASLPPVLRARGAPQQLIVTSAWDDALEQAFGEVDEPLDVVAYLASGPDRGRFLHRSADGGVEVIRVPNTYAAIPVDERTVLLKIHGDRDATPTREWESFVVSEDDHIAYLAEQGFAGSLPIAIAARLRRSHFVFVDYGIVDWSLRVFLHRLWPDTQVPYRSWAVHPPPAAVERHYWRARGVDAVVADVETYVARMDELVRAYGPSGA
jgi:DNA-binding SARP family transcriptional activator